MSKYWKKFMETGSIKDYMKYKSAKNSGGVNEKREGSYSIKKH